MSVEINEVNFPDAAFRQYVSTNFDTNNDGYLDTTEINNATTINLLNVSNISDLTGIEYLEKLTSLDFRSATRLTKLDLSRNLDLEILYVKNLHLTSALDLSNCQKLEEVLLNSSGDIGGLVLGDQQNLRILRLSSVTSEPVISSIDISGCPILLDLIAEDTPAHKTFDDGLGNTYDYYEYYSDEHGDEWWFQYDARTEYLTSPLPAITTQPQSITVIESDDATFLISATGNNLSYQWEVSVDDGENWADVKGASNTSFSFTVSLSSNGNKIRCKISNDSGIVYSNEATLTVIADTRLSPPVIISHPSSVTVSEGSNAQFSVIASGEDLHFQWQTYQNGTWYSINGATNSIYSFLPSTSQTNTRFRCQVSNAAGTVYSDGADLHVLTPSDTVTTPSITNQPLSISKLEAQTAIFRVVAKGGSLSYQWQIKNGNSWYDITGATNPIYSTHASLSLNGAQYRCRVSNSAGTVYSSVATLTVRELGPLPIYGYHSIIISGKNTYGEWEMYPTSRPHVAPPEVKTSYVDVPGADGGLDYTELLNAKPNYGYRKGSWEFLLIPQERWPHVYRSLCNYLHGREHTVVLEDDPNVMYTGRLSVNQWQSAAHNSLITIDYILDPEAVNTQDESYNPDELDLEAAERILRKPENIDCVLTMVNDQITIVPIGSLYEDGDSITY